MDPGDFRAQAAVEPRVVFWYRVNCGFMIFLYVVCATAGAAILVLSDDIAASEPESATQVLVYGVIFLAIGLVLMAAYVASFFLARARWAWIYHIVLICIGLSGCPTIFASLPLLLYWIKPETQAWFRA